MNQVWLAFVLGLDPRSTRSVLNKFRQARALLSWRTSGTPTVRAAPNPGNLSQRTAPVVLAPVPGPATPFSQGLSRYSPDLRVGSVAVDARKVHRQELTSFLTTMNPLQPTEAPSHPTRGTDASDNPPRLGGNSEGKLCPPASLWLQVHWLFVAGGGASSPREGITAVNRCWRTLAPVDCGAEGGVLHERPQGPCPYLSAEQSKDFV